MANEKIKKNKLSDSLKAPGSWQDIFLAISVHLTGFTEFELHTTGMADTYYETLNGESDQDNLVKFICKVRDVLHDFEADEIGLTKQIETELIKNAPFTDLARRIILLWYTGIWTTKGVPAMVSTSSYIEGLIWKAAETHPAGALQQGYGSWAELPLR